MAAESPLDIVPGQFDDALEDAEPHNPRQGGHYIDDDQLLEWSEPSEDEDDQPSGDDFEDRVEDEDWEIAERGESVYDRPSVLTCERCIFRFHEAVQPPSSARRYP
jgi:hypothetical protein